MLTRKPKPLALAAAALLTTAGLHAQTIRVALTTPDQTQLLAPQPALSFAPGTGAALPIAIDDTVRYQKIDGVGASFTDTSAYLVWTKLTPDQRTSVMNDLFSADGIHLSFLRQPMGASDLALSAYTYDDVAPGSTDPELRQFSVAHDQAYILPAVKAALAANPQIKVEALPWSPPAWMKTNGSLNGGTLDTANFPALAKYFTRFIREYEANGVPIQYVSVQNEPQIQLDGYPTMFMNSTDQRRFIAGYLGPALQELHEDRRVPVVPGILGYEHNWDNPKYAEDVAGDPAVRPYLAGVSFHCYAGNAADAQNALHDLDGAVPIYFTECSGGTFAPVFADNLAFDLENEVINVIRNWGQTVVFWNMALDQNNGPTVENGCRTCRGVITVDTSTSPATVTRNVEYYVMGHVSKFVQPGAYRIQSNSYGHGSVQDVAFKNPDGSVAVLVFNGAAQPSAFSLNWNGQTASYTLPAGAAATFVWAAHPGSGFDVTAGPPAQTVAPGGAAAFAVDVNRYGGDRGPVRLATQSLPSGTFGGLVPVAPNHYLLPLATLANAPAGTYPITIRGTQGAAQAASTVQFTIGGQEKPFGGVPGAIPGLIEAEDFDEGGNYVGYFNLDATNQGMTTYRGSATVGVETTGDAGGGYDVGYTKEGEYLRYTVDVARGGLYNLQARVASLGPGGYWHVSFDGRDVTGNLYTPLTGDFQKYTNLVSPSFLLPAGPHVMQVTFDGNGPTGGMGNFNWFSFQAPTPSTPFKAASVPGLIQAEDFDAGGKGVGYWNGAQANGGSANYRPGETVYIEESTDTGGGYDVGQTEPGNWLNYTVDIAAARAYTLHARIATAVGGGVFHLAVDGRRVTPGISVPQTNGFQTWQTLDVPGVELPAGKHTLQLVMDRGGFYNAVGNFNWFSLD